MTLLERVPADLVWEEGTGSHASIPIGKMLRDQAAEIERLRATILNIQALAERGFPIDCAKLATRCRAALGNEQLEKERK